MLQVKRVGLEILEAWDPRGDILKMAAVLFRFFSFSSRNTINISAITRFTNISQLYAIRRSYYVKPKTQNKGSAKTWLTLAGVTLGAVGVSLYMLGITTVCV